MNTEPKLLILENLTVYVYHYNTL